MCSWYTYKRDCHVQLYMCIEREDWYVFVPPQRELSCACAPTGKTGMYLHMLPQRRLKRLGLTEGIALYQRGTVLYLCTHRGGLPCTLASTDRISMSLCPHRRDCHVLSSPQKGLPLACGRDRPQTKMPSTEAGRSWTGRSPLDGGHWVMAELFVTLYLITVNL